MLVIQRAEPKDTDKITEIYMQVGEMHQKSLPHIFRSVSYEENLEYIRNSIQDLNCVLFKAEDNGEICGYLVMYINNYPERFFVTPKTGFVGSIGVKKECRGMGIGTKMMGVAEAYLVEQGIGVMEIDYYIFNTEAEKLYEKLGYKTLKKFRVKNLG